jgi:hypothetical protein
MQKNVLCLVLSVVCLCGCASFDSAKLSEFDQLTVIDMARYTITKMQKNKKFVTAVEAAHINKQMPEVKIHYSAPREGKMLMSWPMKNKTVNIVYSGKFLTDSAMWQMGIVKHNYSINKKKSNPFSKYKKMDATDFKDLMKKR